jgi:outer membrane immunogenic protein
VKKILFGTFAMLAVAASQSAAAADMAARPYTKALVAAPAAQVYNWTGFYIGGHVGGAWRDNNNNTAGLTGGSDQDGRFLAGVQGGADYQFAGSNLASASKANTAG